MKKRRCFISVVFLLLLLVTICLLFVDFNDYSYHMKNIPETSEGIIFSITTYDGVGESEFFIQCLGHAWISIENQSGHTIRLIDYEIEDGEILTMSAWALSEHRGVYFNIEPHFMKQFGRYDGRKSLSVNIDESKMETIGDYIINNDNWTFIKNCSHWSLDLWNAIVSDEYQLKTYTVLYTPARLLKSFDEFDHFNINMDYSSAKEIFCYQKGVRTELKLCS